MKNRFFRNGICTLLAVMLLLFVFVSCSDKNNNTALEYRDPNDNVTGSISGGFVSLWIGVSKNNAADYLAFVETSENGWNTVLDEKTGATFNEMFRDDCVASLKNLLAIEYLHDYVYNIGFTDEQQLSVENNVSAIITSLGSRDAFETEMQSYGASIEDYERYLCLMLKQSTLFNSFYGENGMRVIPEDEKAKYFKNNYVIVNHIYFDMRGKSKDDGTVVSFTEEEKSVIRSKADDVYAMIQNGDVSFEDAMIQYTQDLYTFDKPYGYFVADNGKYPGEFIDAAFALAPGEITMVETKSGIHIIKKSPMDETLYLKDDEVYAEITELLIKQDFNAQISTVIDGVKVYDDVVSQLDASLIKPFGGF